MKTRFKMIGLILTLLFLLFANQTAAAHDGEPPAPHDLWGAWNWDPILVLSLVLCGWVYAAGLQKLGQRPRHSHSIISWRSISFAAGWITLFVALISPLDAVSTALFSAHMLQHMLLIVIAPPLLVLGVSPVPFLLAFDLPVRRTLGQYWQTITWLKPAWRALTWPPVAWAVHVLTLWVWHLPWLYQAALKNEALHILEHLSFIFSALLFWWTILRLRRDLGRGDPGILALFTMALQGGLLSALITFAPTPWYAAYASTTLPWGRTPLEDQQLAGAIMWIPVGTIYTLAALILLMFALTRIECKARQRENQIPPGERQSQLGNKKRVRHSLVKD
jgi:putative membrane protein